MFRLFLFLFLIVSTVICAAAQNPPTEQTAQISADSLNQNLKSDKKATTNFTGGKIRLKVIFLANGKVGDVTFLSGTPSKEELIKAGLYKEAIAAAKKIKFEPAKRNGKPIEVTKTIEYTFSLY